MELIYMDHAATTPVDDQVLKAMYPIYSQVFGNPSSVHAFGRKARQVIDDARSIMARSINASEKEIVFTGGGTEADNMALIGTAMANRDKGSHIITTVQEHHAILHSAEYLKKCGFHVTYLPVDRDGKISLYDLKNTLTDETILVSIMMVNNETGVIQPFREIGQILTDHQAYFHTDAVQAYGLLDIDAKEMAIDLLSASSHKINGPKGCGFLYVADGVKMDPLTFGGEQERKKRPGTENVVHIAGFKRAVELAIDNKEKRKETYYAYKKKFLDILEKENINYKLNGDPKQTIAAIANISFPGTNVESLLANLDLAGVAASSGSACTAGSVEPSHVLSAMFGANNERTTNSIRFSFGLHNTSEKVEEAAYRVAKIVKRLVS